MFKKGEEEKCLNVTIYHAMGLVLMYALYVVVSANFQRIMILTGTPMPQAQALDNIDDSFFIDKSADEENADSDRIADYLASMTASPLIDTSVKATASKGTIHQSMALRTGQHDSGPSTRSMILQRSLQYQRSLKYQPASFQGGRADRLAAIDWSASRATFVKETPLFTWRSSAVHIDTQLLGDQEYRHTLDGIVQVKTSPLLPAPDCMQRLFRVFSSEEALTDLVTMSVNDLHFSAYLFTRQPGHRWNMRFYTVDKLGIHSRKSEGNPVRGPHIHSVDLRGISGVRVVGGSKNRAELTGHGSGGQETVVLEICAPSDDIAATLFERIEGLMERVQTQSAETLDEQAKINRYCHLAVNRESNVSVNCLCVCKRQTGVGRRMV
jgi:hypothetical protein